MNDQLSHIQSQAVSLLKELIAIPSFSKEEENTASCIQEFLQSAGIKTERHLNNVWAKNKFFDESGSFTFVFLSCAKTED